VWGVGFSDGLVFGFMFFVGKKNAPVGAFL